MSATKTRFTSSSAKAVELGRKLKHINETHHMRQHALVEEYRLKSEALTRQCRNDQTVVFKALSEAVDMEASQYGNGDGWALNIERIAEGEVSMVHEIDESRKDNCECPICKLRRSLSGIADLETSPQVH